MNIIADSLSMMMESDSLGTKTITQNGTYDASSDSLEGYSSVTVNVASGVIVHNFNVFDFEPVLVEVE